MRLVLTFLAAMAFITLAAIMPAAAADAPAGVLRATLVVRTHDAEARFLGSAFLFGSEGVILTNAHVVGAQRRVRVQTADGRIVSARVVGRDELRDIAVLRTEADLGAGLPAGRCRRRAARCGATARTCACTGAARRSPCTPT